VRDKSGDTVSTQENGSLLFQSFVMCDMAGKRCPLDNGIPGLVLHPVPDHLSEPASVAKHCKQNLIRTKSIRSLSQEWVVVNLTLLIITEILSSLVKLD